MRDEDEGYYWLDLSPTSAALMGPDKYDLVALIYMEEPDIGSGTSGFWRCVSSEYTRLNFEEPDCSMRKVKQLAISLLQSEFQFRTKEDMENMCDLANMMWEGWEEME